MDWSESDNIQTKPQFNSVLHRAGVPAARPNPGAAECFFSSIHPCRRMQIGLYFFY